MYVYVYEQKVLNLISQQKNYVSKRFLNLIPWWKQSMCTVVVFSQEPTCVKVPILLHWKSQSNFPSLPWAVANNRLLWASLLKHNTIACNNLSNCRLSLIWDLSLFTPFVQFGFWIDWIWAFWSILSIKYIWCNKCYPTQVRSWTILSPFLNCLKSAFQFVIFCGLNHNFHKN